MALTVTGAGTDVPLSYTSGTGRGVHSVQRRPESARQRGPKKSRKKEPEKRAANGAAPWPVPRAHPHAAGMVSRSYIAFTVLARRTQPLHISLFFSGYSVAAVASAAAKVACCCWDRTSAACSLIAACMALTPPSPWLAAIDAARAARFP